MGWAWGRHLPPSLAALVAALFGTTLATTLATAAAAAATLAHRLAAWPRGSDGRARELDSPDRTWCVSNMGITLSLYRESHTWPRGR